MQAQHVALLGAPLSAGQPQVAAGDATQVDSTGLEASTALSYAAQSALSFGSCVHVEGALVISRCL